MKCIHGNEIKVRIELCSPICWDDGVYFVDENGENWLENYDQDKKKFLEVDGCEKCNSVEVYVM